MKASEQFNSGDRVLCVNETSCWFGHVLECRGYSQKSRAVAVMLPDGELSAMALDEVRHTNE